MDRIRKIAEREYLETIKTKTFLVGVLMAPLLVAGMLFFGKRARSAMDSARPPRHVAVIDLSAELGANVTAAFNGYNASHPQRKIELSLVSVGPPGLESLEASQKKAVRGGTLDAFVIVQEDVVSGKGKIRCDIGDSKPATLDLVAVVENLLNRAVVQRRCQKQNIAPKLLAELRRRVPSDLVDIGSAKEEKKVRAGDRISRRLVPFFFLFLMFMGIFAMGQHILNSVIEEKMSRVAEVLLSAISPFQLMAGKILGLAGVGLTVVFLWGVSGYAAARWQGMDLGATEDIIPYFVLYYVLGFILFTSILAGLGSICTTLKEAQGLMMPVNLVFIVPMLTWFIMSSNPDGVLARVLSYIPLTTPGVMVLRLAASPGIAPVEIIASFVVLAASVPLAMWAAAKVFRTGILMTGKRPRLREVWHWLRQR